MAVIMTSPYQQFFDDNGNPLSGGKIYTYRAGTSQLKNSFTDSTENTPAPNPIILDAAGRAVVWISGSYKFVVTDADDNIIRTVDSVTSFNVLQDGANSYFESLSGDGVQTTFSLSQDLGTDENAVFVFIDNGLTNHARNGSFDSDTIWTKGAGWSIGSGVATATGAISTAVSQTSNITLVAGQAYVVEFTMTRSAGTLAASVGGAAGTARSASGTYSEIIIAGSTQALAFTGAGFTGTLDNVRIIPVMSSGANFVAPTQYTLNGESITFASPPGEGTNNISISAPSLLVASAAGSAAAAEQSADNAATSETNAADSEEASESWAIGDEVDRPEGSARAWAVGDLSERPEGSAKVWAEAASEMVIPAGTVTLPKLANIAANSLIGNSTGSPATPLELTPAQVRTLLSIVDAATDSDLRPLKRMTAVTLTNQTSIDFTSIPSWARRITIQFHEVSTNGTDRLWMQLGAGSIEVGGYNNGVVQLGSTNNEYSATSAFGLTGLNSATRSYCGRLVLENLSGNIWVLSGCISLGSAAGVNVCAGSKALSGTLDRFRLTTVAGTDQFDAGTINVMYE